MNKFLDKDDIIELGFYMTKDYEDGTQEYQMILIDSIWIELTIDDKTEDIKTISIEVWKDNTEGTSDCEELFKGKIHNKAELTHQLNTINIICQLR